MRGASPHDRSRQRSVSSRSEGGGRRILLGVTADRSLGLLTGFPEYLSTEGWEVHLVSSPGPHSARLCESGTINVHTVPMQRDPSLWRDLAALLKWARLVRKVRPDIMSVGTPKAGLLGILAGWAMRVPVRIYLLRGLRFETATGHNRTLLRLAERIACAAATEVVAISDSLRAVALREGLVQPEKVVVVGDGSSNGVDIDRFAMEPGERRRGQDDRWRGTWKLVLGYIGRITPDKGIELLAGALKDLATRGLNPRLLVVGGTDSQEGDSLKRLLRDSGVEVDFVGKVEDVSPFLKLIDVLCFPTKREGFGNVIIEAAAAGVPTVATEATGVVDAIVDGVTGTIVRSREPRDFANAILLLLENETIRNSMGDAALKRTTALYSRKVVWKNYASFYESLLSSDAEMSRGM